MTSTEEAAKPVGDQGRDRQVDRLRAGPDLRLLHSPDVGGKLSRLLGRRHSGQFYKKYEKDIKFGLKDTKCVVTLL